MKSLNCFMFLGNYHSFAWNQCIFLRTTNWNIWSFICMLHFFIHLYSCLSPPPRESCFQNTPPAPRSTKAECTTLHSPMVSPVSLTYIHFNLHWLALHEHTQTTPTSPSIQTHLSTAVPSVQVICIMLTVFWSVLQWRSLLCRCTEAPAPAPPPLPPSMLVSLWDSPIRDNGWGWGWGWVQVVMALLLRVCRVWISSVAALRRRRCEMRRTCSCRSGIFLVCTWSKRIDLTCCCMWKLVRAHWLNLRICWMVSIYGVVVVWGTMCVRGAVWRLQISNLFRARLCWAELQDEVAILLLISVQGI